MTKQNLQNWNRKFVKFSFPFHSLHGYAGKHSIYEECTIIKPAQTSHIKSTGTGFACALFSMG